MEQQLDLEHPYLVFNLNGAFYGIEAKWVKEIFLLPELTPIVESRRDLVGLLNLRGKILPVIDLNLRCGYRRRQYRTSDSVIVLEGQTVDSGIIVDQVCDLHPLSPSKIASSDEIESDLQGEDRLRQTPTLSKLIVGVAHLGTDLVMLLDGASLLDGINVDIIDESDGKTATGLSEVESSQFFPDATPQERELLQQRSQRLQQSVENLQEGERMPLAAIGLGGEYFGINLQWVREFAKIDRVTPIPCCPEHIIGNTNLRGEIVTVVEIGGLLNLPTTERKTASQVVVVQVEDWIAGIAVDEVLDTIEVNPNTIVPKSSIGSADDRSYVHGTAPYRDKLISLLDLPKIFEQGELVVDEDIC
jgi:purine-binding chemotaxis protein CheW